MDSAATNNNMTSSVMSSAFPEVHYTRVDQPPSEWMLDPFMLMVTLVALLCCAGGVMATLYVIRKQRKQRRSHAQTLRPTVPFVQPIYRPVVTCKSPVQHVV